MLTVRGRQVALVYAETYVVCTHRPISNPRSVYLPGKTKLFGSGWLNASPFDFFHTAYKRARVSSTRVSKSRYIPLKVRSFELIDPP